MSTDERLITAVRTCTGAYVDGTMIEVLLKDTQASGLTTNESKLAAIAVNIKRIAAIMTAKSSRYFEIFVRFRINFGF